MSIGAADEIVIALNAGTDVTTVNTRKLDGECGYAVLWRQNLR